MLSVSVTRRIRAAPSVLWQILTDPDRLQSGQLGIVSLDGRIAAGETIRLRSDVSPKQVFRLKVSVFEPERRMVWTGGLPFGLFRGRRTFSLTPDETATVLTIEEVFTGPLAGLIGRSMPDLQPSFDTLADGLKTLAEKDPS